MPGKIVIVGAGHAAGQVVSTLRQRKFGGRITLLGDEPYLPYQRPPLSKKFLAGEMPADRLYVRPASFYEDAGVELRLGTTVASIDRDRQSVGTSSGDSIDYDALILAVGSRVRRVEAEGCDLDGVHYLRSIDDVTRIRAQLPAAKNTVIVGAGYIGLEVAAVTRQLGLDVTVLEMADRVMSRVVSPQVSSFYQERHAEHGVSLLLSASLRAILGNGRVEAVETGNGERIAADLVVIGVGILPNTAIAEAAGLDIDNGIVVDDRCRTSDPNIYAVGDCTAHWSRIYERRIRLESVHNALEQAKTAACNICGEESRYSEVPWFWSDQYDLKLQIAGLSAGYDEVVLRGDPAGMSFACLYLRDRRLIACDAINAPRDFLQSKPLIERKAVIDTTRLADTGVALKDLS